MALEAVWWSSITLPTLAARVAAPRLSVLVRAADFNTLARVDFEDVQWAVSTLPGRVRCNLSVRKNFSVFDPGSALVMDALTTFHARVCSTLHRRNP